MQASAISSILVPSTTKPVLFSRTASGAPPEFPAITGNPDALASK